MGHAEKHTYDSRGHEKLRSWIDDVAIGSRRGEAPNRFWYAAKIAVLNGFPDALGNSLLEEPGKTKLSKSDFTKAYSDRTRRFRNDYKRGEDLLYDRFWTILGNTNRYLSRLYHGQIKMSSMERAKWFEHGLRPKTMRIPVSLWVKPAKNKKG